MVKIVPVINYLQCCEPGLIRVVLFGKVNVTDFGFIGSINRQTHEAEG